MNRNISRVLSLTIPLIGWSVGHVYAQAVTPRPAPPSTPSITLSGDEVNDILTKLGSPSLYEKNPQGDFVRVIDPNVNVVGQFIGQRVREVQAAQQVAIEKKAKDDADAKAKAESKPPETK